ncbi:MAG: phosphatase PAP2 family protein [Bacteroidia bacterium]
MIDTLLDIDREWFLAINQQAQNGFLDLICPFIRTQSNWYLAYAVIIYFLFTHYKKKAWWLLLVAVGTILLTDQVSSTLIKNAVQRLRPCNDPDLRDQIRLLVHCGSGYSFVSAHASNHFAVALFFGGVFGLTHRWVWPLGLVWAASIGFSQIYVGVHYPFDVICGSLLGIFTGGICLFILRKYFHDLLNHSSH